MKNPLSPELTTLRDIFMFEQWLRFYFIVEEEEKLSVRVPEAVAARIREDYPDQADLMDDMAGRELNAEESLDIVFAAAEEALGPEAPPPRELFGNPALDRELGLFHSWVVEHEKALDEKLFSFKSWRARFEEWKEARPE